jgi:DNA adenine methylase
MSYSKKYPGQKNIPGVYQKIINQIPAFSEMIELFAGSAQITKLIDLDGKKCTLIDADSSVINQLKNEWVEDSFHHKKLNGLIHFYLTDALLYLKTSNNDSYTFRNGRFIFADPPYHHSTRPNNKEIYTNEMTHEQHLEFLQECLSLNCMCMIIHPSCDLYNEMLKDWRKVEIKIRYHRKTSVEYLYMNYPEPTQLQDYSFLGSDCWDRQRIDKRVKAAVAKFTKMNVLERNKILNELNKLTQ